MSGTGSYHSIREKHNSKAQIRVAFRLGVIFLMKLSYESQFKVPVAFLISLLAATASCALFNIVTKASEACE